MDRTTARLVEFAENFNYDGLGKEAVHACKQRLIDTVACMVAAYDKPLCIKARAVAQRYSGADEQASVLGCSWKTMPEAAAFANGVMMRYLDMMDTYISVTRGHSSDVIPGILAVAEAVHADGRSFINAVALGYEMYCTFCESADINTKGWDQPINVALATVIGCGKLLGLNREQLGDAVALALTPNMALLVTRRGELSNWKGCAAANAARNAVFAAYLARDGFTGPSDVFEGKYGFWEALGKFEWKLPAGKTAPLMITQSHLKSFPIVYHAQSLAWAGLDARKHVKVQDISAIEIESYYLAVDMNGTDASRWSPQTRETADHSLPYILAVALIDGSVNAQSFLEKRLFDPAVLELMQKITVREDPALTACYPREVPCRLKIRLKNGEQFVNEVRNPKGHISNPLDDADIEQKFRDCFEGYGSIDQCTAALRGLWDLERCSNISEAMKLFSR